MSPDEGLVEFHVPSLLFALYICVILHIKSTLSDFQLSLDVFATFNNSKFKTLQPSAQRKMSSPLFLNLFSLPILLFYLIVLLILIVFLLLLHPFFSSFISPSSCPHISPFTSPSRSFLTSLYICSFPQYCCNSLDKGTF